MGNAPQLLPCPEGPLAVGANADGQTVRLSLVLPTLNEAGSISTLLERLNQLLSERLPNDFEVLVVDDDSPDRTWEVALRLCYPWLRVVRRSDEKGLGSAVIRGWQAARGDILAVMDADLQHPPEVLLSLLDELEQGAELAVASRHTTGGGVSDWSPLRRMLSRGAQLLGLLLLPGIFGRLSDPLSGYFAVRRQTIAGIALHPIGYKILLEVVARGRIKWLSEVGYVFSERRVGNSKVTSRVYFDYLAHLARLCASTWYRSRFIRFCVVGGSGVLVDMGLLYLLSDPSQLGWGLTRSKVLAGECAMLSNFLLNDAWTFGDAARTSQGWLRKLRRFLSFNVICTLGLALNVVLLNLLFNWGGLNRYVANLLAIGVVTLWNYWLNTKVSWAGPKGVLALLVVPWVLLGCEERRAPRCQKECAERGACTLRSDSCTVTDTADCERSRLCQVEGRCVLTGQVCAATEDVCRGRPACLRDGACGVDKGACAATSREHCAATEGCRRDGRCSPGPGACVARGDDCQNTASCTKYGSCTVVNGACLATSDADCGRGEMCRIQGYCSFVNGRCKLASAADCARTEGCRDRGTCTYVEDTHQSGMEPTPGCLATSNADCRKSQNCRTRGACRLMEGVCGR